MKKNKHLILGLCLILISHPLYLGAYPIDGYLISGIRRLLYLQEIQLGKITNQTLLSGAQKSIDDIKLNLLNKKSTDWNDLKVDENLQRKLNSLFPNLNESYSISILDISPGQQMRYARRQGDRGFQPGSVGKIAVAIAFLNEIQKLYPDSFESRQRLMREKMVKGGSWVLSDEHTIPIYDPVSKKLVKRQVQPSDIFSLYEWLDHMLSVSNNGAASVVWREAMLMHTYGEKYPALNQEEIDNFFSQTSKTELSDISISIVNLSFPQFFRPLEADL